jgi:hypothetical protein
MPDLPPDLPPAVAEDPAVPSFPFTVTLGTITAATAHRAPLVPASGADPDWTQRLDLRSRGRTSLTDGLGLTANLRLRASLADGVAPTLGSVGHLDIQELALDRTVTDWLTLEAGRINLRNGVATGFNPTDWFKADSLVVGDSHDTADRREDRLGTLLIQGTAHGDALMVVAGFRPGLASDLATDDGHWLSDGDFFGQGLDRTNGHAAGYARITPLGWDNLSTTASLYYEDRQPGLGLEVSGVASETLVLFAEWFGQYRYGLVDEALSDVPLAEALGGRGERAFLHQVALGASWSPSTDLVGARDITLTGEYHFNQAGLDGDALDAWFDAGTSGSAPPGALWSVRGLASDRQEPLGQHQLFLRLAYTDILDDLDLTALSFVSPLDASALTQVDLDLALGTNGTLSLSAFGALGPDRSQFGSLPAMAGVSLSYTHVF